MNTLLHARTSPIKTNASARQISNLLHLQYLWFSKVPFNEIPISRKLTATVVLKFHKSVIKVLNLISL